MNYLTSKQISEKWGISPRRVVRLAREGRIAGAKLLGKNWMIPQNAEKPIDGRTKTAKTQPDEPFFRFPLYVNFEVSSFQPPLTEEEVLLRQAQLDFFMCKFDQAKKEFDDLLKNTENIYLKISALSSRCILSFVAEKGNNFSLYFNRLIMLLSEDFPHRQEMKLFLAHVYYSMGENKKAMDCLELESEYSYPPVSLPFVIVISSFSLFQGDSEGHSKDGLNLYPFLCQKMEQEGYLWEAAELHFILFMIYAMSFDEKHKMYHLRKALDILKEHHFILNSTSYITNCPREFDEVLVEYPNEFAEKIRYFGKSVQENFTCFLSHRSPTSVYNRLSSGDHLFVLYAKMHYTNKQIAQSMKISERTVANRYSEIYQKLGVAGKRELIEKLSNFIG